MANSEHPSERQARLLGERIKATVTHVAKTITPPGSRPPFTVRQSPRKVLAWWMKHRYDALGKQWLGEIGATPLQIAQLDAWLAHAGQAAFRSQPQALPGATPAAGAAPAVPAEQMPNMDSYLLRRAMTREQGNEGPAVGSEVA